MNLPFASRHGAEAAGAAAATRLKAESASNNLCILPLPVQWERLFYAGGGSESVKPILHVGNVEGAANDPGPKELRLAFRYLLVAQAVALLCAAGSWFRVWSCPCQESLQTAAFWTAIVVSQAVVSIGLSILMTR
jgi:hypothetical protein